MNVIRTPSYALVFVRLTEAGRRVSGLRVGRPENGMVRVFARGRTRTVPDDRVSRARRSLAARALHIRLAAEYALIQAAMEISSRADGGFGGRSHDRTIRHEP